MIKQIGLPQLAMGMSEGTVVEWFIQEGQSVGADESIVAIETEKVVTDLPAPHAGFIHIVCEVGTVVPVDNEIAWTADTREEYLAELQKQRLPQPPVDARGTIDIAPEPQRRATKAASGLARKVAADNNIDWRSLSGSGPSGRVVRRDVMREIHQIAPPKGERVQTALAAADTSAVLHKFSMTGMRKTIAERLVRSVTEAAPVNMFIETDASGLVALRSRLVEREESIGIRISLTALYIKALCAAMKKVPVCNSTLSDGEVTVWRDINVAVAVAIDGKSPYESGLVAPVLKQADQKGLVHIERELRELVERARAGRLTANDTAGGTVSLSSSNGFFPNGWMVATPLLNLPMALSFSPGTPFEKPVCQHGQILARSTLPCSITFDHRVMDGVPAGRFARAIADAISDPLALTL